MPPFILCNKERENMNNEADYKALLNYALENGILDYDTLQKEVEMNERKRYLKKHTGKIWQSTDEKWYTYLPDEKAKNGRKLTKRTTLKALEDVIVEYYKLKEISPYITEVFYEWITLKLQYGEIQKQTYDRYKIDFNRFFLDKPIAKLQFHQITEEVLEDFIKSTISQMQLTSKAWSGLRLLIKGIFKYAKKKGYTTISITNFMGDLDLSVKSFKTRVFLDEESVFTDKEVGMIMDFVKNRPPSIINLGIVLMFQTGLRIGELSALKWTDWKNNNLDINKTEVHYKDENEKRIYDVRDETKTGAGMRKVILTSDAINTLKHIRLLNPKGEYIFEKKGLRIKGRAFTDKILSICRQIKIPPRSSHKARKTYGTKLINGGVDEKLVINQLGHTSIQTTKQYYYFNNREEEEIKKQIQNALIF